MTLRTHLIIVALIIVSVFIGWETMQTISARRAARALMESGRAIEIVRASWGLNCPAGTRDSHSEGVTGFMEGRSNPPSVRENNILEVVSALCNLKPQCSIHNSPQTFGSDPAPDCIEKEISIEYRCFSYDRPWPLTIASHETGVIDCLQAVTP